MSDDMKKKLRKKIIEIGELLWKKDLASALNGNISVRLEKDIILITGHSACLGRLEKENILLIDLDGNIIEGEGISTEKLLHTEIYKNFPDIQAVIHTHTPYANGYFLENETLKPSTFENRLFIGEVKSVVQTTPAVTDAQPIIGALKNGNVIVLRNHGTVAMGKTLFDCFCLVQSLEEAAKIDAIRRIYRTNNGAQKKEDTQKAAQTKKYTLFSQEQIDEIVRLVNEDKQMKELGQKTQMNMDLAVKLNETGQAYRFSFKEGQIVDVARDENAEFLITAGKNIWRAVFNQEIDPFVATTQKKMDLKGDFAKISKWYAPCNRIFELWTKVPVE